MNQNSNIVKNFIYNVILTVSTVIFPLIVYPYVSRTLGPDGLGKVNFVYSVLIYFSLFASLGIPTYGIKECAKVRDDKKELSKTFHEIFIINFVLTVIVYIVFIISVFTINKFNSEKELFIIMSVFIVLNTIGFEWLYKGLEKYKLITIRSLLSKTASVILIFLLVKSSSDYVIYGLLHIISIAGYNLLNFFDIRKYIDKVDFNELDFKRHYKMVLTFFAMSASTTIYTNSANVFLGFLRNDAEVGIYDTGVKIKNILLGIVTSLSTVLLPRMSYYWQLNEKEEFKKLVKLSFSFIYLISLPLCIFFIVFAKESIMIVSDISFIDSVVPMQIVMPLLIIIGLTNIIGIQIMIPAGDEKYVLYSEIIAGIVNIVLSFILIDRYGYVGAAITIVITEFVVLIVQVIYMLKKYRDLLFIKISYKVILANILSIAVCILCKNYFNGDFIRLLCCSIIFFITYVASLFVLKDESFLNMIGFIRNSILKR